MTSFCIFGVSKSTCKKQAEAKVPTGAWKELGRPPTIQEWAAKRDEIAAELFERADRRVQVSPAFDAPQFALDWLNVDRSQVRWPLLMVRGEKIDAEGNTVVRKGAPVLTWVEYRPLRVAA